MPLLRWSKARFRQNRKSPIFLEIANGIDQLCGLDQRATGPVVAHALEASPRFLVPHPLHGRVLNDSMIQRHRAEEGSERLRAVLTLLADLAGDGVAGDRQLEGNEEAMRTFDQVIRIDQRLATPLATWAAWPTRSRVVEFRNVPRCAVVLARRSSEPAGLPDDVRCGLQHAEQRCSACRF